jgi:hypothetical protein
MQSTAPSNSPVSSATTDQIFILCQEEMDSLFNLRYLIESHAANPVMVMQFAGMMDERLERISGLLCRQNDTDARRELSARLRCIPPSARLHSA